SATIKGGKTMATRTGLAVWDGTLKQGKGTMKLGSGAFEGPYSFSSRFEEGKGTNPEELIGAAEAGCYSMALSANLEKAGHPAKRISTTATVKLEMIGGELQRFAGESVTRIRAGIARPKQGIDSESFVSCDLRFDQRRIFRRAGRVVAAGHVHFDIAEAALRQMRLQRRERVGRFHVWHKAHVDLRDRAMRQNCFAAGSGIAADQTFDVYRRLRFKTLVRLLP